MSWFVNLMKFSNDISRVEEAKLENVLPLGTKAEVLALLVKWFPNTDFHDPSWISVVGGEVSEIILSDADAEDNVLVDSLGFRNPSYRLLRDICAKMKWKAFDASAGDFIDFVSLSPEMYVPYFVRTGPQPEKYIVVDLVVYLRNRVMDTWVRHEKDELRRLADTLETLNNGFENAGFNSPYWVIVDKLAYFARHFEFADYQSYIPTEEDIRKFDTPEWRA